MGNYKEKFKSHRKNCNFHKLDTSIQLFIEEKAYMYKLSFQDIKQLVDMSIDLNMWDEEPLHVKWIDYEKNKKKTLYM